MIRYKNVEQDTNLENNSLYQEHTLDKYKQEGQQHLLTTKTAKLLASCLLNLKDISKFDLLVFFPRFLLGLEDFLLISLLIVISLDLLF